MNDIFEILKSLSKEIGLIVFVWLISFVFSKYSCQVVRTEQMEPRLAVETVKLIKKVYTIQDIDYGEIVAYLKSDPFNQQTNIFWGRVIAKENDRITIKDNKIYLNGNLLSESYLSEEPKKMPNISELIVPAETLFVLNDKRNEDYLQDSKDFGPIYFYQVVGKLAK